MFLLIFVCSLDIIYTANIGGEFLGCGCPGEEGGIARIAYYIKNTPHNIILDAGGIFGKNRFIDSLALVYLNDYGFDAIAVSANELRFGAEFIRQMSRISPLICSNVYHNDRPVAQLYLAKTCNGKKILITSVIDTGYIKEVEGLEAIEPSKALAKIKARPELKNYDLHINIINGEKRFISIEKMGAINVNWNRRIGLLKIYKKNFENSTTILDSTIPEDEYAKRMVAQVIESFHKLPAREVITTFPAYLSISYYDKDDTDTLLRSFFPNLAGEFRGLLGIKYLQSDSGPYIILRKEKIEIDSQIPNIIRHKIIDGINNGGDEGIQFVYFPNLNCPECQRYNILLKAFGKEHPNISVYWTEDEVLLERFYEAYELPKEKRKKPIIFSGERYLLEQDIKSENLYIKGKIPWLKIYGIAL